MTQGGQSERSTRPADPPRLPLSLVRRRAIGGYCRRRQAEGGGRGRARRESLTGMGVEAVLYRPFDHITLSFNSFRGYRVPRHSIPPLTSVVNADLSTA